MNIGFALTGSFCTAQKMIPIIENLSKEHSMHIAASEIMQTLDTRFGKAEEMLGKLEKISGRAVIQTIAQAEAYGPSNCLDILVIAPTTGSTLGKLANGITDNCITMLAKAHLRNGKPLLIGVSTNDGLSRSAINIAKLMNMKNIYFVPYSQDDPDTKPFSIISKANLIESAIYSAVEGKQLQPVLA